MNCGFGSDQMFVVSRSGSGDVLRFDMSFGQLSKKPEFEVWKPIRGLREFTCVAFKHSIYIFGGYSIKQNRCVEYVKRYDANTNEWTDLPPMAIGRRMCTAVVFKNEIIVCGGFKSNNKLLCSTEIFNIQRKKWRKCSNMKNGKADQQLLVLGDSVIGFGGVQQVLYNKELVFCGSDGIFEFKDVTSGWQTLDDNHPLILWKPVYLHSIVEVDSKFYIIGGLKTVINNDGELSEVINCHVESLFLGSNQGTSNHNMDLKGWVCPWDRSIDSPSIPRYGAAAVKMGHDIYLIGGTADGFSNGVTTVEKFQVKSSSWIQDFYLKENADLSMVCAMKIYGSKYKLPYRSDLASHSLISTSFISDEDDQEEDNSRNKYRVGWVLW